MPSTTLSGSRNQISETNPLFILSKISPSRLLRFSPHFSSLLATSCSIIKPYTFVFSERNNLLTTMALGFSKLCLYNFFTVKHLLIISLALNLGLLMSPFAQKKTQVRKITSSRTVAEDSVKVISADSVINLDHGDPTMFERFWKKTGDKSTIVIPGWQSMSYFSDIKNLCWFLEPELATEITRLHQQVRNANTQGRYIIVGTGSSQLIQAVLYALSPVNATKPISVVSALPYYSAYPSVTDYLKSGLYKWAGDANKFNGEEPCIEFVTSPNNPDGHTRESVVNHPEGFVVHDLAYYWPQYTPITSQLDHDIMLFTVSKGTGHAGTRIGWALVKDKEVAKKMIKLIELNTIGVSKDSQLRAAKILRTVSDSCKNLGNSEECFFENGHLLMAQRWKKLRNVLRDNKLFSLPEYKSDFCSYTGEISEPHPAFAWLRCEGEIEDCGEFLREHKILTRSGKSFGVDVKYVRVSMVDREENFNLFIERLSTMS